MKKNVEKFFLIFTIFTILLVPFVPTHAQETNTSLDGVIVKLNDGAKVKVSLEDYAEAFMLGNQLFDFLRGNKSEPVVIYVSSTDKYIDVEEYATNFMLNGEDESDAINTSPLIPSENINEIKIFNGFNNNGEPVLEPVIPQDVYFKNIPGEIKAIIPGKYGIGIKFIDANKYFQEINEQTILILSVYGKEDVKLPYNDEYKGYLNKLVSGYTEEELLGAKVMIYNEQDEVDDFRVIGIY